MQDVVSKLKFESSKDDVEDESLYSLFNVHKPVSLPKLVGADVAHYMNYIHMDLRSFQILIRHRPFDKTKVVSKINAIIKWWGKLIESPPPDVKQLMDGFSALKEALTADPQSLALSLRSKQDQADKRAAIFKNSQEVVAKTCASLTEITKTFEEQLASQDREVYEHSARVLELKSEIEKLNAQLKQAEADQAREIRLKDDITRSFYCHKERLKEATFLQSELSAMSKKVCNQLQGRQKVTAYFADQDDEGLTEHVRSFLDFFMSCSAQQ